MRFRPPILLSREEARDYLGGVDPEKVAPPLRYGRSVRWARWALDAKIKADAGLGTSESGDGYDAWRRSRDEAEGTS